jgi:hypothetical protein
MTILSHFALYGWSFLVYFCLSLSNPPTGMASYFWSWNCQVVLYDREVQALVCALLTVHANIPEVATNLPLVLQPTPSESAVLDPRGCFKDVVKALPSFSKRLEQSDSGNLFGQGSLMTRTVKAELLDWTDKKTHGHNFDVVSNSHLLYCIPGCAV